MKEDVKEAHKKIVLKLHLDKNQNNQEKATELFKASNTTYQNSKSITTPKGHRWANQAAPQPYHTNFQFNLTYYILNFCGQNEPSTENTARRSNKARKWIVGTQRNTRGVCGFGGKKTRQAEPQRIGAPPP